MRSEFNETTLILYFEGQINSTNAPGLESESLAALNEHKPESIVIDCATLEYISSAGLRVLLSAQKRMNRQGSMKLVHVNDMVKEVFEITGFSEFLAVE